MAKQWKHAVAQWQRLVGSAQQQRDADPRKLGTCIANLGLAFQGGGANNKALACFQHALAMLSPLEGTAPQQIMLLANLATMYKTAGNIGAATQCLNRAARIRAQPQQPAAGAHPRVSAGQLDAAITAAKDGKFGAVVKLLKGTATRGAIACHHHSVTGVTALMLAAALCKYVQTPLVGALLCAICDCAHPVARGTGFLSWHCSSMLVRTSKQRTHRDSRPCSTRHGSSGQRPSKICCSAAPTLVQC